MSFVDVCKVLNAVEEKIADLPLDEASVIVKAAKVDFKGHPHENIAIIHLNASIIERICDFYPNADAKVLMVLQEMYS